MQTSGGSVSGKARRGRSETRQEFRHAPSVLRVGDERLGDE